MDLWDISNIGTDRWMNRQTKSHVEEQVWYPNDWTGLLWLYQDKLRWICELCSIGFWISFYICSHIYSKTCIISYWFDWSIALVGINVSENKCVSYAIIWALDATLHPTSQISFCISFFYVCFSSIYIPKIYDSLLIELVYCYWLVSASYQWE